MLAIAGAVVFVIAGLTNLAFVSSLRQYRIDLAPGESWTHGRPAIWQLNVFNPDNYNALGRRRLSWAYAGLAIQSGAGLLFVFG